MTPNNTLPTTGYKALTIVSPMMFGDDSKDQDRARWYEPGQSACICDGVSSSPNSAKAAELAASFIPVIFDGNTNDRLTILCELLMALRQESQEQDEILLPENITPAMQDMLRKVVKEKQAGGFQTTMVAARFISDKKMVLADVLKFGDSAFFAFSPDGQLLTSSLDFPSGKKEFSDANSGSSLISFGPGDKILVRVEGQLPEYRNLAKQAAIRYEHIMNWLVCSPVDGCRIDEQNHDKNLLELQALSLRPTDQLLVPKFLNGRELTCQDQRYQVLRYSSTIRPVYSKQSPVSIDSFNQKSSATMVLPDHFYRACFDSFQDSFPLQTHFILCSDGFYSSFSNWQQLWNWLQENSAGLNENDQREVILKQLHTDLHAKSSDDDISFIWVQPNIQNQAKAGGGDKSCQQNS